MLSSNITKPIIYIDLDGTIVDFVTPAMMLLGHPNCEIPLGNPNMETWPAINISKSEFWRRIAVGGTDFWSNLEKYPWSDELVAFCESLGDVYILTSPSRNPDCSYGKVKWVTQHFPRLVDRMILTGHKHLCAAPGRILIDDTEEKTSKFEEYGGKAILFPQPWNKNHNLITNHCPIALVKMWVMDRIRLVSSLEVEQ